ncbi:neuromedin-U receptor 2-like [Ruditapes philippinarum]|uniref:neuromedin-U receptor 2-like n=1 Tax=Ruditapes philippinarum TaxID=129788 RepID=UPI00295BE201|nr:neuromedin-U receptor 2-like [Ruditapes philippinarum]
MANASIGFTDTFNLSTEANIIFSENGNTSLPASLTGLADQIQQKMNTAQYFVCPTLFVVGIVGNICTVLTVSRAQFHQMTSRFILYALAVSDSLLLFTNPFNQQFMTKLWMLDVRALSKTGCKFFFVMYRTGKMSSSWFIVLVAVERFVAIMFPLKAKQFLTKTTVCTAVFIIYSVMISVSGIWTFSTDIVNETCMSDVTSPNTKSLHKSFVIVGAMCYSIIPIIILLILTPLIIVKLCRSQYHRKVLQHNNIDRSAKDTSRVTVMLIGIVITYIVCVTPISLVLILTFWTNEPFFSSKKIEYIILAGVAMSFEQLNHSSNFFVYILCCRQFRQRFVRMVCWSRNSVLATDTSASIPTNTEFLKDTKLETQTHIDDGNI